MESGWVFVFFLVRWVFHEGGLIFDNIVAFRAVQGALQTQGKMQLPVEKLKAFYRGKVSYTSFIGKRWDYQLWQDCPQKQRRLIRVSVCTSAAPAHSSVPLLTCWARWCDFSGIREHSGSPFCWQSCVAETLCRRAAVGDFIYTATLRRWHLSSLSILQENHLQSLWQSRIQSYLPAAILSSHPGPNFLACKTLIQPGS